MNVNKTVLIIFLFSLNILASSLMVTSDITTNTTWDADTVILNNPSFSVLGGVRLTIKPGTVVKLGNGLYFITVYGTITAEGTETDSIRFSKVNSQVSWQGIRFLNRAYGYTGRDSSYLKYCDLENTTCISTDSLYMKRGSAVYCGAGNYVEINNSTLLKNRGDHGGAVYVDSGAIAHIDKCHFGNNTAESYGGGAIMTNDKGSPELLVENCRFEYNSARTGGAVWIGKGTKAEFNNCVFFKDTTYSINPVDLNGGAVAVFGPSDVTLRNCLIFHCRSYTKGGGIYTSDASIKLINCTITRNSSVYGGGIYFARKTTASSPLLVNTIEGGNGTSTSLPRDSAGCGIFLDSSVTPIFRHCQLYDTVHDFKIKPYTGEFTSSKYFRTFFVYRAAELNIADTAVEGYQLYSMLGQNDPAIDAGTPDTADLDLPEFDLLGRIRINGTAIDIGALEYYDTSSKIKHFSSYKKTLQLSSEPCDIIIYSLRGQKLGSFKAMATPQSIQQFVEKKFPQGIYLVTLKSSGRQVWSKNVFVK